MDKGKDVCKITDLVLCVCMKLYRIKPHVYKTLIVTTFYYLPSFDKWTLNPIKLMNFNIYLI